MFHKLYTNTIFSEEKEAKQFAKKSMKRNEQYKVVEYTIENIDDYSLADEESGKIDEIGNTTIIPNSVIVEIKKIS